MKAHLMKILLKPFFNSVSAIGVSILLTSPILAQTTPNPSNINPPTETQEVTDSVNKLTPNNTTEPTSLTESTEMTKPTGSTESTEMTNPTGSTEPTEMTNPTGSTEPKK